MISFCRIHSRLSLVEQRILSVCVRVGVPRAGSPLSSRPRRARHTLHEGLRDLHGCDANFGPWTKVATDTDSHSTWHRTTPPRPRSPTTGPPPNGRPPHPASTSRSARSPTMGIPVSAGFSWCGSFSSSLQRRRTEAPTRVIDVCVTAGPSLSQQFLTTARSKLRVVKPTHLPMSVGSRYILQPTHRKESQRCD